MRNFLLAISAVSLVATAWLLFQLEKQSQCFQSRGVERIAVYESSEHSRPLTIFPVCPRYHWSPGGNALEIPLRKALAHYDQLIDISKQQVAPIRLHIVRQPEMQYSIDHRTVILGQKIAVSQGQIFKALISQWLLQLNSDLMNNKLLLEVLGDFYFSMVTGAVEIANPLNGSVTELGPTLNMDNYNLSFRDLCRSPWVPGWHLALCSSLERITGTSVFRDRNFKTIVEAVDRTMSHWTHFSLRPVFDYLLWKSYLNADLTERLSVVRTLAANLKSSVPKWYDWESGIPKKKQEQVFADTETIIQFWQKPN